MKRMVVVIGLLCFACCALAQETRILFWNLENFFDYHNDSLSTADAEFSSFGERRWTKKRFLTKCGTLAKALLWIGEQQGDMPDVLAFAEVENRHVLWKLLDETPLRKLDYRIVHYDSPDPRGIDVALLYRSDRWSLLSSKPCHIYKPVLPSDTLVVSSDPFVISSEVEKSIILPTRDILQVTLLNKTAPDTLSVLVNHHPSKYGGAKASQIRRQAAVDRLRAVADSLQRRGERHVVALGDFNDTPDNPLYATLPPVLHSIADSLHRAGRGSIRFNGVWELIDLAFVSPSLTGRAAMDIITVPFLMVRDGTHPGDKPLRTYEGPRYKGGVSDHLPITVSLMLQSSEH